MFRKVGDVIVGIENKIEIVGSITKLSPQVYGKIVVAGSHGGELSGAFALRKGARGLILNDAGIGLENAGIRSLEFCQRAEMAAVTVSYLTCRIGNGEDILKRGVVSRLNEVSAALGIKLGEPAKVAANKLMSAKQPPFTNEVSFQEKRHSLPYIKNKRRVILVDSASMILPKDEGHVVVTGSHGGLIGGDPHLVIKAQVSLAFFNDAGVGIEEARHLIFQLVC